MSKIWEIQEILKKLASPQRRPGPGKKLLTRNAFLPAVPLGEAARMYDIFNKKEDGCVKVVLKP